jgi:hypothetical protein
MRLVDLSEMKGSRASEWRAWSHLCHLSVLPVSRAEFEQMIRDGLVTDDSTLAAYLLLLLNRILRQRLTYTRIGTALTRQSTAVTPTEAGGALPSVSRKGGSLRYILSMVGLGRIMLQSL